MQSFIESFRQAMLSSGIAYDGEIIADGELHRFKPRSDRKGQNGWYVLYGNDIPAGSYGDWKRDISKDWSSKSKERMTSSEWEQQQAQIKIAKEKRDKAKSEAQVIAREKIKKIWNEARPASDSHPYLLKKGIKNQGIRSIKRSNQEILIIPLYDSQGTKQSAQFINVNGDKWFLTDGVVKGGYFPIGKIKKKTGLICIGEGWATCAQINEILECAVACAFNCGNLLPVALMMRAKYPDAEMVILADNDQWPNQNGIIDNRGLNKAREAAEAIGAVVKFPDFTSFDVSSRPTDWNDLKLIAGIEECRRQLAKPIQEEWPEPKPIQNELLPVESLLSEIIPEPFRDFVTDVSNRMQCPIDFVAAPLLTISSIIIGTGCCIKPKRNDDWLVVPNVWGCIVGRPGIMKSPAVAEPMQFLDKLQNDSKNNHDEEMRKYKTELKVYQSRRKVIENEIERSIALELGISKPGNNTSPPLTIDALKDLLSKLPEPLKPVWKRFKTNDSTIEKLTLLLSENKKGMLVFRDELIGLLRSFDKIGHESDRAFYLESWNGTGSYTADRVGSGTTHAENLCLSLFGTTQPDKLLKYLYATLNGDNDGLLQRFQLLVYPDDPPDWTLVDKKPNTEARIKVFKILNKLSQIDFVSQGATKEENDRFPYFVLDDKAQTLNDQWITDLEVSKLRSIDLHPLLIEHLSKFRSLMPSLALIFHLVDLVCNDNVEVQKTKISEQNVAMACAWCDYLESHAKRIYGLVIDVSAQAASALASKIKQGKLKDGFTWRDLQRNNWTFLNKKSIVEEACEELIEKDWLKKTQTPQGKPSYLINPQVKKGSKHE